MSSQSEKTANGMLSGSASMIVIGWRKLSNCAASTMYMKSRLSRNAVMKFWMVSSSALARPPSLIWYCGGRFISLMIALHLADRDRERHAGEVGEEADLALAVLALDLRRPERFFQVHEAVDLHELRRRRPDGEGVDGGGVVALGRLGAEPDVVLLVLFLVLRDRLAADEQAQRLGDLVDAETERRGALAVDRGAELGLPDRERGVDVDEARVGAHLVGELVGIRSSSLSRLGPSRLNSSSLWRVPPPRNALMPWTLDAQVGVRRRAASAASAMTSS